MTALPDGWRILPESGQATICTVEPSGEARRVYAANLRRALKGAP